MSAMKDLIGKKINMLTVLREDPDKKGYLICQCDCGNTVSVRRDKVRSRQSCGCEKRKNSKRMSIIGTRLGRLLVESLVPGTDKGVILGSGTMGVTNKIIV